MYPWKQRLSSNRAVVLTTLLYGCESWTLYRRSIRRLDQFHLRYLRKIARVKCQGRIPNTDVLNTCGRPIMGIEAFLLKAQLRWVGHIMRIYFLDNWQRENVCNVGQSCGTKTLWRLIRSSVRGIDPSALGDDTHDRSAWRTLCHEAVTQFEDSRVEALEHKRAVRKGAQPRSNLSVWPCDSCCRVCSSRIGHNAHRQTNRSMTCDPSFSTAQSVRSFQFCRNRIAVESSDLVKTWWDTQY